MRPYTTIRYVIRYVMHEASYISNVRYVMHEALHYYYVMHGALHYDVKVCCKVWYA